MARKKGGARKRRGAKSPKAADGGAKERSQGEKKWGREGGLAEWMKSFGVAIVIFIIFRFFLIQTFVITSGSMENTLLVGDFLVVNKAAMGSRIPFTDVRIPGYAEPERGDILVFDPPHEDTLILVKRLIGMPGDTVEMRDRALYVNGRLQHEPYVVTTRQPDHSDRAMLWQQDYLPGGPRDDYMPSRDTWGPIVIPPDRYFMLGDNRDSSLDGRTWGLLERWRLEGRVWAVYFSYNRGSFQPFPWIREIRWSRIGDRVH